MKKGRGKVDWERGGGGKIAIDNKIKHKASRLRFFLFLPYFDNPFFYGPVTGDEARAGQTMDE